MIICILEILVDEKVARVLKLLVSGKRSYEGLEFSYAYHANFSNKTMFYQL